MIGLSLAHAEFIRDEINEVVLDTRTHLVWQDDVESKTILKNFVGALSYCETLNLGGHSDWHLPSFNELYYLADRSKYNPSLSATFQNVALSYYWSSTTNASNSSGAWVVRFYNGGDGTYHKATSNSVRCVR